MSKFYSLFKTNLDNSELTVVPDTVFEGDVTFEEDVEFDGGVEIDGTTSTDFTVASGESDGKVKLDVTGGGTDHTITITNSVTTANRTITLPDATDTLVGKATTDTLTNKSIDGDDNTVTDLPYSAIKSTSRSGSDVTLVTGTKGTNGNVAKWNADGDLVDGTNSDTDVASAVSLKHSQNTDTGTTGATFTVDSDAVLGKIVLSAVAGASDKSLTLQNTALTDDRIATFQDATGTVALTTDVTGSDGTTSTDFTLASSETDGKIKLDVTGGGTDHTLTLTNTITTANRTITFPDATGTLITSEGIPLKEVRDFNVSFETDEVLTLKVYFPYKVTVNKIRGIVTKAIAATDDATVTCGNSTGASTGGVVTFTASDALAVERDASPTTNNVVEADSYYFLTTAKTTAGGKALISIEATRTA